MSHRGEDVGGGSDVEGSGGGLLTCCTSAGLPPPPPPQPLLLRLLVPAARRTAVETSAGRSSDRRSDACPDVSRPGRMSLTRREKRASNQTATPSSRYARRRGNRSAESSWTRRQLRGQGVLSIFDATSNLGGTPEPGHPCERLQSREASKGRHQRETPRNPGSERQTDYPLEPIHSLFRFPSFADRWATGVRIRVTALAEPPAFSS